MAWVQETDSQGGVHNIFRQEHNVSCGVCCCIMILRLVLGRKVDGEGPIIALVDQQERALWNMMGRTGRDSWDSSAALVTSLTQVLSKLKVQQAYTVKTGSAAHVCKQASPSRPALLTIRWSSGGEHATLCLGQKGLNNLVFLDPFYGVVELYATDLPKYPHGGTLGVPAITT